MKNYKTKEIYDHTGRKFKSIKDLCQHYGIARAAFDSRMQNGWSIESALITPVKPCYRSIATDYLGNEFPSITAMCKHHGIKTVTYKARINYGWTKEKALTTPIGEGGKIIYDHNENPFPSVTAMCQHHGIPRAVYNSRIKNGWPMEKALTIPAKTLKKVITDHKGNVFASLDAMCKHYGIKKSSYHDRIERGWTIEQTLTTPLFKNVATVTDPLGNKFHSSISMSKYHNVGKNTYIARLRYRWSIIEALNIIPRITCKTKNTDITPNLHVINHVCDNTYFVIHNGTETLMHHDEITQFATEYFRQQNAVTI